MYFSLLTRSFLQPGIQHNTRISLFRFPTTVAFYSRLHHGLRSISSTALQTTKKTGAQDRRNFSSLVKAATVFGVGLGFSTLNRPPIHCDGKFGIGCYIHPKLYQSSPEPKTKGLNPISTPADRPPPPESSVSLYQLGFGTVAGLCAGVFVKKGAKAVAWFLGGIFVLLQVCNSATFRYLFYNLLSNLKYLGSTSIVRVDWERASNKFENLFYTKDSSGAIKPPNVLSLWNWLIDFLTADFQPRASFIAGFALGLRIG